MIICYFSVTPTHRWISCCSSAAVNFQDKVFKRLLLFHFCKSNCTVNDCLGQEVEPHFPVIQLKPKQALACSKTFSFSSGSSEEWKKLCFQRGRKDASSPGITRCLAGFDLKKLHKFPESTAEPRVRLSVGIFHCCLLRAHKKSLFTGS